MLYTVERLPNKLVYMPGQTLDITGLSVVANYADGSAVLPLSDLTIGSADMDTFGIKTVTVSFCGVSTSFDICIHSSVTVMVDSSLYPESDHDYGYDIAETKVFTYTVRQYCDTILADESNSQYHALIKEMLNYGGAAQTYFGYNTDQLASAGITGAAAEEIPKTTEEMSISDSVEAVDYYGATLVYRDKIAVRFYFTGDVNGCTFTADGNSCTPVAKDDKYYVEIADILPQDLDQQITLTVTDSEGSVLTVTYGPMNYIVRMNQKGSDAAKPLLKALYNYHLAAKVFCSAA